MSSTEAPVAEAPEIFLSYSHKDKKLRDRLAAHLAILEQTGQIKTWHDRKIKAGQDWNDEINSHLNTAHTILLLVSADFIASGYCWGEEMARAMERHEAGQAIVIPVILRECEWGDAPFSKLQALPENGLHCTSPAWGRLDSAFTDVTRGIMRVLKEGAADRQKEAARPGPATPQEGKQDDGDEEEDALLMLPYLCDRDPQEDKLEAALEAPLQSRSTRPFLCIIYGGQEECHDKFRERLQRRSLSDLLGARFSIQDFMLKLPDSFQSREACFKTLLKRLALKLSYDRRAGKEEIVAALSQFKAPVIIHSTLGTDEWEPEGERLIEAFVEFWNDGWELPSMPHLFVLLHVEYNRKRPEFVENEPKVERFLQARNWAAYGNVHVACLPKLSAIKESDATDWLRDEANFRDFCDAHRRRGFCDVARGVIRIGEIYLSQANAGYIPMQTLAPELKKVLRDYSCKKDARWNF